jgi:hypothetical protein
MTRGPAGRPDLAPDCPARPRARLSGPTSRPTVRPDLAPGRPPGRLAGPGRGAVSQETFLPRLAGVLASAIASMSCGLDIFERP